jgi:lipopolysaccharide export LptBFGC system permease protein LptF
MSRTIFWYIFKDLLRVFMMTSGALAGIMSFGGLLRPLTHQGLDITQVGQVLAYFGPAMTTYSFPIAALFATTVIYGRLSADNELTACRAGGLSLVSLSVAGPAMVLGLIVATVSLLFLCFVVPASTLKVEKVLYSNLAQLVANRIERTHEIRFAQYTIFAQDAWVPAPEPGAASGSDDQQRVVLRGPTIVTVDKPRKDEPDFQVPREFWTAAQAIIFINQRPDDDQIFLTVRLQNGFKFPRKATGALQAGVEETECGPIMVPSPIKEDTKFMDIWKLKRLYVHPDRSQRLRQLVADLVRRDQSTAALQDRLAELNGKDAQTVFTFEQGERYVLRREAGAPPAEMGKADDVVVKPTDDPNARLISFLQEKPGQPPTIVRANELRLRANPDAADQQMDCSVSLLDCTTQTPDGPAPRANFTQQFTIPMTPHVASLAHRGLMYYTGKPAAQSQNLNHESAQLLNEIAAECHDRASFAISCLILVMVGCALGMIFRSGNFLSAFAVSFIPALLSITLTIAGQRTAGNIPMHGNPFEPLMVGLVLIWTGNLVNMLLAGALLLRLHRT